MQIEFYVVREGPKVWALHALTENIREIFGERIETVRARLKAPLLQMYQEEADSLCRVGDSYLGFTLEPKREKGAFLQAFCAEWEGVRDETTGLPLPLSEAAEKFHLVVHPVVAQTLYQRAYASVYPGLVQNDDFFAALSGKPNPSPESASPPRRSRGQTATKR